MSYMLLILEPRDQRLDRGVEAGKKVYEQMQHFAEGLQKKGVLRGVESLARDTSAVRVQQQDGRLRLTDGPFTESKEMIGGFFMIDVATRAEAVAIAAQCPAAQWCTVEVRETGPCWE
jgi:hypothetical protein